MVTANAISEKPSMVPEKQITEFVSRVQQAAGENLQSVILYGSAAGGEFHPEFSNVNLLCILREITFAKLSELTLTAEWWTRRKHPPPLIMTQEELERSADVFSIELLDMKRHHRVLSGEDVLQGLSVPLHLHRAQLEYELREKSILLRERVLLASADKKQLWELLLSSLGTFTTLFRHALIALGGAVPGSKRETLQLLAARVAFDPSAFVQLLDIREKRAQRSQLDVKDVAARYLQAIQQTVAAVDRMLDSPGRAS
jgi:hypothetical protein